jgi:hypothetical protein
VAHGKPSPGNTLYRNLGNGKFEDVTAKAGVAGNGMFATGLAVGDYDNDGYLDVYVTGYGGTQLFRNNGDGTFREVTARAGVGASGWSTSAAWVDYDRDGYLDLFVGRYVDYDIRKAPYCGYRKPGYRRYCDPQVFDGDAGTAVPLPGSSVSRGGPPCANTAEVYRRSAAAQHNILGREVTHRETEFRAARYNFFSFRSSQAVSFVTARQGCVRSSLTTHLMTGM